MRLDKPQHEVYEEAVDAGTTVLWLNPQGADEQIIFDAGVVPVPKEMLVELIQEHVLDESVDSVYSVVRGLTLKEVAELIRICSSAYDAVTPENLSEVRKWVASKAKGLYPVDTEQDYYRPEKKLDH